MTLSISTRNWPTAPQDFHLKLPHLLTLICCFFEQQKTKSDRRGNTECHQALGSGPCASRCLSEIARRTCVSRSTISKHLHSDADEPRYSKRVSPSKLDPFAPKLATWLKTEASRSCKQRRTVKQLRADLQP